MIKNIIISMLLVYTASSVVIDKPINVSQRDEEIIYNEDGSVTFYDAVYRDEELKELHNILKKCDIEFMKRKDDNINLSLGQIMGRTRYHQFYYYIQVDTVVGNYYSNIVVWDLNVKIVRGILVREYDRKYEINKKPFYNITGADKSQYLFDLKKYYSSLKYE